MFGHKRWHCCAAGGYAPQAAGRPGMGAGTGMMLGAGGGLLGGMLIGDMISDHEHS